MLPNMNDNISQFKAEIRLYEKEATKWHSIAKRIVKRYKDENSNVMNGVSRYNMLWSMVQTLLPALYARNPKPDVSRRFMDKDPVGRVAANVLERSCGYFASKDAFGQSMRQSVLDFLLGGRGTTWCRYVPHFRDIKMQGANDEIAGEGLQLTDDADIDVEKQQEVYFEEVAIDYVHWEDFGHSIARNWEEVRLVWRKVYMSKEEIAERWDMDVANKVPYDHTVKDNNNNKIDNGIQKSTIYEVWDKLTKKITWVHKDLESAIEVKDDFLMLQEFFPCPRPLLANLANDSCIPTPDYKQWQHQANELDELTSRIDIITKAVKIVGVYDRSIAGLDRMFSENRQNELIPVDNWALLSEKGGLKGVVSFFPLQEITQVLTDLYAARDKVKQDLYEITGIADIIRGVSDAKETAAAQQLKGQFAVLRLSDRQQEIQRFARDIIRIIGEIVASKFGIETIKKISGVQLIDSPEQKQQLQMQMQQQGQPQQLPENIQELMEEPTWAEVETLLRDEPALCFRIDIETDSTIKSDQAMEKQERMEFLSAVSGFIKQGMEAGVQNPDIVPLMGEMLMFGVRAFSVGKDLEGTIEAWQRKVSNQAKNPEQKPDPEMAKTQGQMQLEQQKMQNSMQLEQHKMELSAKVEQSKQEAQALQNQHQNQLEAQRETLKMQNAMQIEQQKAELTMQLELKRIESENERIIYVEKLKSETQILIAQISANATLQQSAIAAKEKANTEYLTNG